MDTEKRRFIQVDDIPSPQKRNWIKPIAVVFVILLFIVPFIVIFNLYNERDSLLAAQQRDYDLRMSLYQQIDSLNQQINSLQRDNDRLHDEIVSMSQKTSTSIRQDRNSASSYQVIVEYAKLYEYARRDDESTYMMDLGLSYTKGTVINGEIVQLPPHGRYLKVSFNYEGQNRRGFISLSDLEPIQ